MVQSAARIVVVCVLTVAVGAVAHAQSVQPGADAPGRQKKQANQVPDTGVGQPDTDTGTSPFERVVENLPITVRADGTTVVELDDSFMEATAATVDGNGALQYEHFTGLETASLAVRERSSSISLRLPARALPLAYPIYEVK